MTKILQIRPFRISDRTYAQALKQATDTIFEYAANVRGWDWSRLAQEAQLSYCTVHRLGTRVTRWPREQTFWKLACACGLQRQFVDNQGKMILPATAMKQHKKRG